MDAKHVNNILAAFTNIMPMLGMDDVQKKGMSLKGKDIHSLGIGVVISLVGDIKGNIIYTMTTLVNLCRFLFVPWHNMD